MIWLKFFIIFFLFVVFLIILIPYRYKISGSYYKGFVGGIYIYPLFGILVITFKIVDSKINLTFEFLSFKKEIKVIKLKKETKKNKNIIEILKNKKVKPLTRKSNIEELIKVVEKILSSIKPNRLLFNFKIGFQDPMWTGLLFSVLPIISLNNKYRVKIDPVFNEEILEGSGEIHGKIWIPIIIREFIRLFLNKPLRNILLKT